MDVAGRPTLHATAVLVGARALLMRGPSGSGKSRLALALIDAAAAGLLPFARLVGDDRILAEPAHGRLLVRPVPELAGLVEVRGLGLRRLAYEPLAVAGWVVDLAAEDGTRLPETQARSAAVCGVALARLPVAPGAEPLPIVLAALRTTEFGV